MTEGDRVMERLARLPVAEPSAALSGSLRAAAHARLLPVKVHPAWAVAIAASVVAYLGWAILYTSQLY